MDAWKPPLADRIKNCVGLLASALAFDLLLFLMLLTA